MKKRKTKKQKIAHEARQRRKEEFRLLYEEAQALRNEVQTYREALEFIANGHIHGDDHTVVHRLRDMASMVMKTLRFAGPVERLMQMADKSRDMLGDQIMTPEEFIAKVRSGR